MKKLTYWVVRDVKNRCYNIRSETREGAKAMAINYGWKNPKPRKVCIEYSNPFDLVKNCMGEGGGFWEDN